MESANRVATPMVEASVEGIENATQLAEHDARIYRGGVGLGLYLAPDRPEI